jgi:hypothetical protein
MQLFKARDLKRVLQNVNDNADVILCLGSHGDHCFLNLKVADAMGYTSEQKEFTTAANLFFAPADKNGPIDCIALDDIPNLLEGVGQ